MANNRMWLVNTRTGARILLAKYYPSTGWYCRTDESRRDFGNVLDEWFDAQDFGHLTELERRRNERQPGLGVPHISAGGMWGAEYKLELEETESG